MHVRDGFMLIAGRSHGLVARPALSSTATITRLSSVNIRSLLGWWSRPSAGAVRPPPQPKDATIGERPDPSAGARTLS